MRNHCAFRLEDTINVPAAIILYFHSVKMLTGNDLWRQFSRHFDMASISHFIEKISGTTCIVLGIKLITLFAS